MKPLIGQIISKKMKATSTILVERVKIHPLYKKRVRVKKKYHADDNQLKLQVGDWVKISPCRPVSKLKRFKVIEVIKK
jgi:small subunit ribosomal protein S17